MNITLILQLLLLCLLQFVICFIAYQRGRWVGFLQGQEKEQDFGHRRAVLLVRKTGAPWTHSRN